MTTPEIEALGRRAESMIRTLAAISSEQGRITRLFLSPEHRRAADIVAGWMAEAGLTVSEDALGTVRGRLASADQRAGANGARRLLIGSHIDSVINAGAYDGILGVVAGIIAVDVIRQRHGAMPFGIDVLAFGDEEGSRFRSTLSSSKAVAARFDPATLAEADANGVSLDAAIRAYGKDPTAFSAAANSPDQAAAYLEVHIEQGPVLEARDQPLGVVTAIAGQTRLTVAVGGVAGHAGTVPMGMRHDALLGAAEMALAVEAEALAGADDEVVGTVARIDEWPGASNVIPAFVEFAVDLRSRTDAVRLATEQRLRDTFAAIAARRGLELSVKRDHQADAAPCDARLQAILAKAAGDLGLTPPFLPSGAGHDGQAMRHLCPIGMLFVRCRGGISHNPAEFASVTDMGCAIATLVKAIEAFEA
jgi:allantoate deiminase